MNFSVLMSVYRKENPSFLRQSIVSVLENSVPPKEFVIVKDGLLTPELDAVLDEFSLNPVFKIIGYEKNLGLGEALNIGLAHCSFELVARMDSDDISCPSRFEKELKIFQENKNVSVVGSNVSEFIDSPDNIVCLREVPEYNADIIRFLKKRNPINHPSVMFKKETVVSCGGYIEIKRFEDYYLWYRIAKGGYEFYNIQENLLLMRTSNDFYNRRGGKDVFKGRNALNKIMLKDGQIGFFTYLFILLINFGNYISPKCLRKFLYKHALRKKMNNNR